MNTAAKTIILDWYNSLPKSNYSVADIGAYNINGSVKNFIPNTTGFDIYNGKGVDVVIQPGIIPDKYKFKFDLVITTGAFQFCDDPELFKIEILDLLVPSGKMLLTMCAPKCPRRHTSSPITRDNIRMSLTELEELFSPQFICTVYEKRMGERSINHHTLVLEGIKK